MTIKIHVPLVLLAALAASASGKTIVASLQQDTVLQGAQFPALLTDAEDVAIGYNGNGLYDLSLEIGAPAEKHFALVQVESNESCDLGVSFSEIKNLSFSGKGSDVSSTWAGASYGHVGCFVDAPTGRTFQRDGDGWIRLRFDRK